MAEDTATTDEETAEEPVRDDRREEILGHVVEAIGRLVLPREDRAEIRHPRLVEPRGAADVPVVEDDQEVAAIGQPSE